MFHLVIYSYRKQYKKQNLGDCDCLISILNLKKKNKKNIVLRRNLCGFYHVDDLFLSVWTHFLSVQLETGFATFGLWPAAEIFKATLFSHVVP